jgi:DNA repair exonuclease SbcCD ATPase subunit
MLIRKPEAPKVSALSSRLEQLLSLYEKNLQLEIFFIQRKDIESLLDLLPGQGDLIIAISKLLPSVRLPAVETEALQKRLEAADALRDSNKAALDQSMKEAQEELDQMNQARQRIRQVRQLSKTMYQVDPGATSRLQDWA